MQKINERHDHDTHPAGVARGAPLFTARWVHSSSIIALSSRTARKKPTKNIISIHTVSSPIPSCASRRSSTTTRYSSAVVPNETTATCASGYATRAAAAAAPTAATVSSTSGGAMMDTIPTVVGCFRSVAA
eukprot:3807019-Prymnesium_polylepis.1